MKCHFLYSTLSSEIGFLQCCLSGRSWMEKRRSSAAAAMEGKRRRKLEGTRIADMWEHWGQQGGYVSADRCKWEEAGSSVQEEISGRGTKRGWRKSCRDGWAGTSLHAMTDVKWHAVKCRARGGCTAINTSFNQTLMIC